MNEQEAILVI